MESTKDPRTNAATAVIEPSRITGYHAHVYYDQTTRASAEWLRDRIEQNFVVRMGRWRETPVGPHPKSMYQIAFDTSVFALLVPWLMLNRRGLSIMIHPETGNAYSDHAFNALWLGEPLKLRLWTLRRQAN
jgi:aromatic ring-cleaving dioxygenase